MAGRGQTVTACSTVIFFFVSGLSEGSHSHDHITTFDVLVVDYIGAFHAAGNRAVDDDSTNQVAHVGCLSACRIATDSHFTEFGQ